MQKFINRDNGYSSYSFDKFLDPKGPFLRGGIVNIHSAIPSLPEHDHDVYEFIYLIRGVRRLEIEREIDLICPGGYFTMIRPHTQHRYYYEMMAPSQYIWFHWDPRLDHSKNDKYLKGNSRVLLNYFMKIEHKAWHANRDLTWLCKKLVNFVASSHERSFKEEFLNWMVHGILMEAYCSVRMGGRAEVFPYILDIIDMLNHFSEGRPPNILNIAKRFGLSERKFYSDFKNATGFTPAHYIRCMMCEKSKELMNKVDMNLTDIAYQAGFLSSQQFSSIFRKYTGYSPSHFRKQFILKKMRTDGMEITN